MTSGLVTRPDAEPIRVLHVEDDPTFADLTRQFLQREADDITVESAIDPWRALDRLGAGGYDCVLSDYDMPGLNGIEFLERVHETDPDLPFVLFTGKGSEEVASEAIGAGVSDYLQKETSTEQFALLANRLENLVEQYRSRRALAESRERLSLFVEQSPLGIIEWAADMTVVGCNEAAEEILGYDASELAGASYHRIVAEESRADVDALAEDLTSARGGFYSVDRNLRADGTEITCEWHNRVITDESGDPVAIFSQFLDVSDREERERALDAARARYHLLVEHFPDGGVFLFDEDLRYTLAGGQELDAVGLTAAAFEGATPWDLFPEAIAEETAHYYRRALAGEQHSYEQAFQGNHYRVVTLPVRDGDGEVLSGMAVSMNVTESRDRAAALEHQFERMAEFASVVSHDLRNPLDVARGHLELVAEECDSDHVATVDRAHGRMAELVDDLLTLARTGDPVEAPETVALAALARESWLTVDTGAATLRVESDRAIRADSGRLRRLFENLYRNAIEHGVTGSARAADGAPVTDETGDADGADTDAVTVTVGVLDGPPGERGFFVADDGPGIPRPDRDRVFEGGYSTAPDGTGFGLRIARQIAETHGWELTVTDSEAGGARFEARGVVWAED